MRVQGKYFFMIFTVIMFAVFNYCFFTGLKKSNDALINQYIIPQASIANKEHLQSLMAQPYYLRSQIEEVNDLAFKTYKESLMSKDLLAGKIKNILLLNMKVVFVDNFNFYFRINYLVNICLLVSFLFAMLYKEPNLNNEDRHEPIFDI